MDRKQSGLATQLPAEHIAGIATKNDDFDRPKAQWTPDWLVGDKGRVALENRKLMRVGDVRERPIDVRIVAATNRELLAEIEAGRFRKDLFFRLGTARLTLPPLRARRRELPVLARAFLAQACARLGREPLEISSAAMYTLAAYPWPGNVRELRNLMEFVAATVEGHVLLPWHLAEQLTGSDSPTPVPGAPPSSVKFRPIDEELRELERQRMVEALTAAHGISAHAAELIAMPIRTFSNKLKLYGLAPQVPRLADLQKTRRGFNSQPRRPNEYPL